MPLVAADDPNATYFELATFDASLSEFTPTSSAIRQGHYNIARSISIFSMGYGNSISKTFPSPIDISKFTEIALWYYATAPGIYFKIGIGQNVPNEYTTIPIVQVAYGWGQLTWDISDIPQATLQNIKYITIQSMLPQDNDAAPSVAFEEMVARRPTMLEAVVRQIKYLFHEQITITANDGQPYLVPAVTVPEFDVEKLPAFVYSIGSAVYDYQLQGRVIDQTNQTSELINTTYKMRLPREPYVVSIRIEIRSNFQNETWAMQEFIPRTMNPRGALACAGDLIDCVMVTSSAAPIYDTEKREFRYIYEYSLWTWLDALEYANVAALQFVTFTLNPLIDIELVPIEVDQGGGPPPIRPDVYITEIESGG